MPAAGQPLVVRPINAQTGAIRSGVGSAVFEVGSTRVVCAVYGPQVDARQEFSERGRLACEVKVAAFARPARSASAPPTGAEESAFAAELHTALSPSLRLDAYPKSSWQLCAFVVEDDGSALPALINCASLALADAGIQMFDMVAACSVACFHDGRVVGTPTAEEEASALGQVLFAQMAGSGKVSSLQASGLIPANAFDDACAAAAAGCAATAQTLRAALVASWRTRHADVNGSAKLAEAVVAG